MAIKTKLVNWIGWRALCVLSLLTISSCKKDGSVAAEEGPPESVILEACKKDAGNRWGGGNVSDVVRGSPLPPDKGKKAPVGTLIYPIRVVYQQLQEQPFVWDSRTHLPRPGELKAMPMKAEFRFDKDEFGEWHNELVRGEWVSATPGPRINDYSQQSVFYEAFKTADIDQLEALLDESKAADQKNGGSMSHETKLRQTWLESAKNIQESLKRREQERADRLNEQEEDQRQEQQRIAELDATAEQRAVQEAVAAEEAEAARLYAAGWVGNGRDGRTIDEFMFLGEWKYPQQARAAMERAKAHEEQRLLAEGPKRLAEYHSSFQAVKAKRDQQMREEIEYQKLRTRNPERYSDPYKHFFYADEIKAWLKSQSATGP